VSRGSKCVTVPNFPAIETAAEIGAYGNKMAAAAVLDCQNVGILRFGRVKRVKIRYCDKFRCDR